MTPIIDGRTSKFVGQVWLDYLSAGASLVYLFYEPKSGTVAQVYDYD
jgi:arginyl-tRNA--protein-N-Asp/Glu arginylyltransferase